MFNLRTTSPKPPPFGENGNLVGECRDGTLDTDNLLLPIPIIFVGVLSSVVLVGNSPQINDIILPWRFYV